MLKLKDVSKFYYNKGVIASGFTKVSTQFDLGEFVVITGESGSGKSTLLNVLSGLDTYEEGEMYINGAETSHYGDAEFEDYRKKYISNIFQNFNLVNSYSVYQNVELVLLINGYKKKDIKDKVLEILKQVDLYKFRKRKVAKLSGGQKQRVAIARALAKDTPIIIADEPTGNLDSRSAASVLETLAEVAKNKLVIIVTHNYGQVEKYATRKIKMHDGRIIEDKALKTVKENAEGHESHYKNITKISKLRLGLRNTFNIIPKFLLIFMVYFFIVVALLAVYSVFMKNEYEYNKLGHNYYFYDTTDTRIVIKKTDKSFFTDEDYQKISNLENIGYIVKDDIILDSMVTLVQNDLYLNGPARNIKIFKGDLEFGRMPENENEVLLVGAEWDYYIREQRDAILDANFSIQSNFTGEKSSDAKVKVVGIQILKNMNMYSYEFYVAEKVLDIIRSDYDRYYSEIRVLLNGTYYTPNYWDNYMRIEPNGKVPEGQAFFSSDLDYACSNYRCRNKKLGIENKNLYYEKKQTVTLTKAYNKNNFTTVTGLKNYYDHNGKIFVNPMDYKNLYEQNSYQSSVFVKDIKQIDVSEKELQDLGLITLKIKDTLVRYNESISQTTKIVRLIVTVIIVVVMFFISYFIIKIILKSRNVYFSTIRILGASKRVAKQLLNIELLTISHLAYFSTLGFIALVWYKIVNIKYIYSLIPYLTIKEYVLAYLILLGMTLLIASKFAKSLFKKSAMKTYNEEV